MIDKILVCLYIALAYNLFMIRVKIVGEDMRSLMACVASNVLVVASSLWFLIEGIEIAIEMFQLKSIF